MSKNLDIVLVNAPSPHPGSVISHRIQGITPLGIGYIAEWLKSKGFKVTILDFYIDEVTILDLYKIISELSPRIVAISTTTETYNTGIRIASACKKYKEDLIVFMGGCHVTFQYEDALKTGLVDVIIRHEGEYVVENLCNYYINDAGTLKDIKGICYLEEGTVVKNIREKFIEDLDSLPIIDRKMYNLPKYAIPGAISTSRGCPGNCIFCAASALAGGKYRTRSADSIIEEFKYLKSLGMSYVQIVDDTMTADLVRLYDFLNKMSKLKLGMTWGCESRVDVMSKDLLKLMKECGCISLQFGVEAGSQTMLDCLKKNVTIEQIRNVFLWAREVEIKTGTCLMIGQPYDTIESIRDTITFAQELQSYGAKVVFSVTTPFPGTYLYKNPEKIGIRIMESNFDNYNTFTPVCDTKSFNRGDIQKLYFDAILELGRSIKDEKTKNRYRIWRDYVKEKAGVTG